MQLTIKSLHFHIRIWIERAMATKLVCLLISSYLLLAGDYHVVSGFTPVTYSSESSSTECGQSDPLQDEKLMAVISQVHQRLGPPGCNPPETDLVRRFSMLPISSLRLPQDTCWFNGSLVLRLL